MGLGDPISEPHNLSMDLKVQVVASALVQRVSFTNLCCEGNNKLFWFLCVLITYIDTSCHALSQHSYMNFPISQVFSKARISTCQKAQIIGSEGYPLNSSETIVNLPSTSQDLCRKLDILQSKSLQNTYIAKAWKEDHST